MVVELVSLRDVHRAIFVETLLGDGLLCRERRGSLVFKSSYLVGISLHGALLGWLWSRGAGWVEVDDTRALAARRGPLRGVDGFDGGDGGLGIRRHCHGG